MELSMRPYKSEADYWKIRAFLRQVLLSNGLQEQSWHVARLDYWRWHLVVNVEIFPSIDDVIYIWETMDGDIAAVLNPEGQSEAFLQVAPRYISPLLLTEMLSCAETKLSVPGKNGKRVLTIWCNQSNTLQKRILLQRGYAAVESPESKEHLHFRLLNTSVPGATLPVGYTIRSLAGEDELPGRSWASWLAFHPNDPDGDYDGWEWYVNLQRQPLYRRDLDLVVIAPGGQIVAFCTVWYDDVTRCGYIEPVGTVPEHQRRGLARALLYEGMRRLQRLGGERAFVGGYSNAANALYTSVMGSSYDVVEPWVNRDL